MKFLIITKKKWKLDNFKDLNKNFTVSTNLNVSKIKKLNPKIIFFIHWSKIVSKSIYEKYLCIQFHSSNLPKGRGGSPIQNQILLNKEKTNITAFKIVKNLDAGPICLKDELSLKGNASEIFERMENKSIKMIKKIIKTKKLKFNEQKGTPSYFKRRSKLDSEINFKKVKSIRKLYDFLRMLDAPGYPKAYIKLKKFKIFFNDIKIVKKKINANVEIKINEK
ncbi:formyltransferase family protein [Candidatus Pelagibacter sp. HIMB1782]|uniref:formyltransferase family protein n=1 Tax=Candidatus Pelagibacter sp. HIMB1782 TaxID=3413375 RepID=UPI003F8792D3